MKETIYTIPINEAFDAAAESGACPICALHRSLERDSLEYALGASMMEPDVRQETNRLGFCADHFDKMLAAQKRLPLSLILQSHLDYSAKHASHKLGDYSSCYLCTRVKLFLRQYYTNIVYLWSTSPDFRRKFTETPVICLRHSAELTVTAKQALSKKENAVFAKEIEERTRKQLEALHESVSVFCKSFDHRYAGMELGEHKTSVERCITYLSGERL